MTTIYVKPKFYNSSGTPYSGGFVYVYQSGTKTPLTTYKNAALTTPNTNPIVLDGEGSADIWFTGMADYEVYDSNMRLQWRQSGIFGPGSMSFNIDSTNRTVRNLRGDDDIDGTLGYAEDRCGRFIQFDCEGNPDLLTPSQVADVIGATTIGFVDLGYFSCPPLNTVDFGFFGDPIESYINLGIFFSITSNAFIPPRLTGSQISALTPVDGMIVYNTDTNKLQCYNGSIWNNLF